MTTLIVLIFNFCGHCLRNANKTTNSTRLININTSNIQFTSFANDTNSATFACLCDEFIGYQFLLWHFIHGLRELMKKLLTTLAINCSINSASP